MKMVDKATVKLNNSFSSIITSANSTHRARTSAEINELMDITQSADFFIKITRSHYSNDFHRLCCMHMIIEEFSKGSSIYKLGEQGNSMFIVLSGSVSLNLPPKIVSVLTIPREFQQVIKALKNSAFIKDEFVRMEPEEKNIRSLFIEILQKDSNLIEEISECKGKGTVDIFNQGESFGVAGILTERLRSRNATANTKVYLAVITRQIFKKVVAAFVEKKMNDRIDFLHKLSLFSTWSRISISRLLDNIEAATFFRNQKVFNESDNANFVVFIMTGELKLTKNQVESKNLINYNSVTGESIGNMDLRMRKVKKIAKLSQIELVVKGRGQIIGIEDMSNEIKPRSYNCFCYSSRADVLLLNRQTFLDKVSRTESFSYINTRRSSESAWLDQRVKEINQVDYKNEQKVETPSHKKNHASLKIRVEAPTNVYYTKAFNTEKKYVIERAFTTFPTRREYKKSQDFKQEICSMPTSARKNNAKRLPPPNFLMFIRERSHSITPEHVILHHAYMKYMNQ